MPDARYLYQLSLGVEAIDDPIWSIDNLANSRVVVFWNDTTCFGMSCKMSVRLINSYPKDSARWGLSRAMKRTMLRRSSRAAGDQISLQAMWRVAA